jgi:hypothetical protein
MKLFVGLPIDNLSDRRWSARGFYSGAVDKLIPWDAGKLFGTVPMVAHLEVVAMSV